MKSQRQTTSVFWRVKERRRVTAGHASDVQKDESVSRMREGKNPHSNAFAGRIAQDNDQKGFTARDARSFKHTKDQYVT